MLIDMSGYVENQKNNENNQKNKGNNHGDQTGYQQPILPKPVEYMVYNYERDYGDSVDESRHNQFQQQQTNYHDDETRTQSSEELINSSSFRGTGTLRMNCGPFDHSESFYVPGPIQ